MRRSQGGDRAFILSVVDRLDGGIGEINARVMESFRMWALADLRSRITRLPVHEQGISQVTSNLVSALIQASSTPDELDGWSASRVSAAMLIRRI